MAEFKFKLLRSMGEIERAAWLRLYGRETEGFDYFAACEKAPTPGFSYSALAVFDGDRLVAGSPVFYTSFDPALVLEGVAHSAFTLAARALPSLAKLPIVGLGTPHSQETALAFDATLTAPERTAVLATMVKGIEHAAIETDARIILFKDVGEDFTCWGDDTIKHMGYARATGLPVAILKIPESEDAYIKGLSGNMRSNLRRRLKRAKDIRVEIRTSAKGLAGQLHNLRATTMARAAVDYAQFAETSTDFYDIIMNEMPDNARILTYWLGDTLIGFTMVILGPDKLVQNYNGMCYPEGPDHGLFYLDWMTQVRLCLEHGIPEMQSGVTTYLIKSRLGCELHRCYLYIRHRHSIFNSLVSLVAPTLNLELSDPGLKELGASAPFAACQTVPGE